MTKSHLFLATALLTTGLAFTLAGQPTTALAKTTGVQATHVTAIRPVAYHLNQGALYQHVQLTHRYRPTKAVHTAVLYTYKSANLKMAHGKHVVVDYVKNANGSIKGWTRRSNLTKQAATPSIVHPTTNHTTLSPWAGHTGLTKWILIH